MKEVVIGFFGPYHSGSKGGEYGESMVTEPARNSSAAIFNETFWLSYSMPISVSVESGP